MSGFFTTSRKISKRQRIYTNICSLEGVGLLLLPPMYVCYFCKNILIRNDLSIFTNAVAKYAGELLRERTPEEREQGDRELTERLNTYMKRSKQRRVPVRYVAARPRRFFGIKIGWFY